MPPDLWRLVHRYPRDSDRASQHEPVDLRTAGREMAMSETPLENKKTLMVQAHQDCSNMPGLVAGLEAEIHSVNTELAALRGYMEKMQVELLHETERRLAAEAVLRGELASSLQEVRDSKFSMARSD